MTVYADRNGITDSGLPPIAHALRGSLHSDVFQPSGAIAEAFSRDRRLENTTALSTGRLTFTAVHLTAGQVVTSITFHSATTALGTGSNQWFCLYSSALAKLAVTSDDTSTAWAANTPKTLNLSAPYTVATTGLYYVGINVVASQVPTLVGCVGWNAAGYLLAPALCGTSNTGLTNPASAPDPADALAGLAVLPWCYVS